MHIQVSVLSIATGTRAQLSPHQRLQLQDLESLKQEQEQEQVFGTRRTSLR